MWNAILDTDWQPAMPPTYCYVDTYLTTQDRLLAMPIDQLASAHWPIQRGPAVREYVAESRNYVLHVEAALLDYARAQPDFTLREAVETLGPKLGRWPAATNQDFSYGMAGNLKPLPSADCSTRTQYRGYHDVEITHDALHLLRYYRPGAGARIGVRLGDGPRRHGDAVGSVGDWLRVQRRACGRAAIDELEACRTAERCDIDAATLDQAPDPDVPHLAAARRQPGRLGGRRHL